MAGADRKTSPRLEGLLRELVENPSSYGFFQLMRIVECLHPEGPRLGSSKLPSADPIRLGQHPSMSFETASISSLEAPEDDKPPRLYVRLLGLLGPNGPLPIHLTEYAQRRTQQYHDPTFARFLDIFHHRFLSLFYRAWANNEPTVSFDRPESDRFSDYVATPAGLGMSALRNRDAIPDLTKISYSGRLASQTRCPEGLEALLAGYFRLPARLEEFIGTWLPVPHGDWFALGSNTAAGRLGAAILGTQVWDCQNKFRVIIGPLSFKDYESFLPGSDRIGHVVALVRNYAGDELAWDLMLVLKKQEVPPLRLDGRYRLGWTAWLGERQVEHDADDLVLNAFERVNKQN